MAQKSEQQVVVTPSPNKQKSSIWKRVRSNSGKKSSKKSTAVSPSSSPNAAEAVVTITINNGTAAAAAAAAASRQETVDSTAARVGGEGWEGSRSSPFLENTKSKNYTMEDELLCPTSSAVTRSHASSDFSSIISRRQLSFTEEESPEGNGLVIQEVTQTSFGAESFLDWAPFGAGAHHVGLSSSPSPHTQSNEVFLITGQQPRQLQSIQYHQSQHEEALFKVVKKVDGNNNDDGNLSLADPPSTQRKTLTPEFFIGSGSNNINNTSPNSHKHQKKRLHERHDTTTSSKALTASSTNNNNTTTTTSMKENNHNHNNNLSSNISSASSSEGGQVYAEIYLQTKPKKHSPPPPSGMMGARDRSTLSSHSFPSLAMTAVSSLSGRSSMFGTVNAQENGCCAENPMPVTREGVALDHGNVDNGEEALFNQNTTEYNYFDYDANIEAPLSPQGVSPQRPVKSTSFVHNVSRKSNWKSRVNMIWTNVSKHTCRCLGEPFSREDEQEKWKLSSATTAVTSTTAAYTANSTAAQVRMNLSPMFSSPVEEPVEID